MLLKLGYRILKSGLRLDLNGLNDLSYCNVNKFPQSANGQRGLQRLSAVQQDRSCGAYSIRTTWRVEIFRSRGWKWNVTGSIRKTVKLNTI